MTGAAPKRIMIVDDSAVVRRMLMRAIEGEPGLEVDFAAPSGPLALKRLEDGGIDLVLLDVEMPEMDGIETVGRIRERWPRLPVVMCSSLTERGGMVALRALERGATDCIAKPSTAGGLGMQSFRTELIAKLRMLLLPVERSLAPRPGPVVRRTTLQTKVNVIAIGSSTGGPNALGRIFSAFPGPLPVPVVIVQHMPAVFTRLLAERITSTTGRPAKEGADGERINAGTTYVAPGGRHMALVRDGAEVRIRIHDDPPEQSCRPAVDVLFRSVAEVYKSTALGCVLTGMGCDGTAGAQRLVEAGGVVLVQDTASCVVPSMPNSVERAGLADAVIPLPEIAHELYRRAIGQRALPITMQRTGAR